MKVIDVFMEIMRERGFSEKKTLEAIEYADKGHDEQAKMMRAEFPDDLKDEVKEKLIPMVDECFFEATQVTGNFGGGRKNR